MAVEVVVSKIWSFSVTDAQAALAAPAASPTMGLCREHEEGGREGGLEPCDGTRELAWGNVDLTGSR